MTHPCPPRVSVVIPSYNGHAWLPETVGSALQQQFGAIEILVVDDGSPDPVDRVLPDDAAVRYVRQANAGPAVARNTGIAQARGEYVALLDDDDLWATDKLVRQVAVLDAHPEVGVVFSNYRPFGPEAGRYVDGFSRASVLAAIPRTPLGEDMWRIEGDPLFVGLLDDLFSWTSTLLIRTALLRAVGAFDPALQFAGEDWQLCLKLATRCAFAYTEAPLAQRRERSTSLSKQGHDTWQRALALEGLLGTGLLTPSQRQAASIRLAAAHFDAGYHASPRDSIPPAQHFLRAAGLAAGHAGQPGMARLGVLAVLHALRARLRPTPAVR